MKRRLVRTKIIAVLLETLMLILHSLKIPLKVVDIRLQVADEQLRLAGNGSDGRVVRVGQLDVVRG
jgi:hypothetical protein